MMSFHELLVQRRSVRKFQARKIEQDKIALLKEAVLRAPSGKRKNHWEFIFVQDQQMLKNLSACKLHGSKLIADATLAVIVIGDATQSDTWIEDCSIASILLQMQAEELELGSCWVQVHKRPHDEHTSAEAFVKELTNVPNEKNILSIVALGYPVEKRAPLDQSELLYHKIFSEKYGLYE